MSLVASACAVAARAGACPKALSAAPARQQALVLQHAAAAPRPQRHQQLVCRAAAESAPPAEEEQAAAGGQQQKQEKGAAPRKPQLVTAAWQAAVDLQQSQETIEVVVKSANRSGLSVPIGKLQGFLPYKLLDPSRLEQRQEDGTLQAPPTNGYQQLVGQTIKVKVTQVIVPEKRLICSEKAVLLEDLARSLAPGDIIEGRVGAIMSWGAFIEARTVNGKPAPHAECVLPLREASWGWLSSATEVVQPGKPVRVMVLYCQVEPKAKVVVSLKRLEDDPLQETLDKVLPINSQGGGGSGYEQLDYVPAAIPNGVDDILEALAREKGVEAVSLGRCVEEKRTVSQDLELWITKEALDGGYNLAVRAGRMVQEVHVSTAMSPQEMRSTVQRVLRSIN